MGRLIRETSPTPGFKPAILPQHEKADGSYVVSGENNPLPVGNYVQNDSGIWVPVSKQNPMPTQLTGRNVEETMAVERTVTAGSRAVLSGPGNIGITPEKLNRYSSFVISARSESGHDYQIEATFNVTSLNSSIPVWRANNITNSEGSAWVNSDVIDITHGRIAFTLTNQDTEDHIYDYHVYWRA